MDYINYLIQGIVQGLTEFLPVSSSGHLNIVQHFTGTDMESNLFLNVMLHLGTLIAVCVFYHKLIGRIVKALFSMIGDIFKGKFSFKNMDNDRNLVVMLIIGLLPLFLLFIPVGNGEYVKDWADTFSSDSNYFIVTGIALMVTSALLLTGIILDKRRRALIADGKAEKKERYTVVDSLVVGVTQAFAAVFPGLSRSGSTLAAGELRGISKQAALDYTFVLAIPSILAAAVLEFKDVVERDALSNINWGAVLVGVAAAAVVGYLSIALFKWLLKTDKTYVFVIYTALAGVAVTIISIVEMCTGNQIKF